MQVGMELHLPRPGVQDRDKAAPAAEVLRVREKVFGRPGGGGEERGVGDPLVAAEERAQRFGHREGEHEVRHRQQARLLPGRPLLLFACAAARAGAVVATVVGVVVAPAIRTAVHVPAQTGRATRQHGPAGAGHILRPVLPK